MRVWRSIQYLRALAALAVAGFHALQWLGGGFEVGRAGVDVFFVISGVVMWTVTAGHPNQPLTFIWRRFTRVAPPYWIITLALAGVVALWPAFLPNVHPEGRHIALSLAFIPHRDPVGLPFPLLPAGWTLNYEAVFYLIFALCLLAPQTQRAGWATAALAMVSVGGLIYTPAYELGANPIMLQFAAGLWLGKLAAEKMLPGARGGLILLGLGFAVLGAMETTGLQNELWRPLLWGLPAVMIVLGAMAIEADGQAPTLKAAGVLGDASYAIYLAHMPATAVVAHTLGTGTPWLFVPVALAASTAAGLAFHICVEKPLLTLLRRGPGSPPVPAPESS